MKEHFFEEGTKAVVTGGTIRGTVGYHIFDFGTIVEIVACGKGFDLDGYYLMVKRVGDGQTQYIKKADLMPLEEGEANGE
jgi:hypothetical protein